MSSDAQAGIFESENPAWEGGEGGERAEDAAGAGEAAQRLEEDDADLAPDEAEIDQARAIQEEQANVDEITRAGDAPLSPAGPPRLGGSLADGALVGVADATEAARKFKEETAKGRRELRDAGAKWYILHPDAPALLIWDTIQAVVIFFLFIELPIRYGFFVTTLQIAAACEEQYVFLGADWVDRCADDAAGGGPALETKGLSETHCIDCGSHVQEASTISEHELSDYLVDILMMLDWLLRFVRAFYDYDYHGQRHLRVSLSKITKHYAQNNMIRDTLACWPLDTIFILADHPQFASAVRLLRLLRMERVIDFKRSVDSYVDAAVGKDWLRPVISGVSLILGTFFFNHVLCCVLYRLGSELYDEVDCSQWETDRCGWVARQDYRDGIDWDVKYGDAFYYSFTILTTVGFGDISAHSTLERIATVFAMTAGCAIFGIVMGQITAVIHGMNMGLAHYEERVRELEQYMAFRDVNPTVRERVKRFLVEKYPEKRVYDERQILGTLPVGLRTEFLQDMYADMVEVLPFIPAGDHEVLTAVCRIMRQEVIMPGEIIVREGVALRQVFTVVSGEVAVAVPFVAEDAVAALKPAEWMLTDLQLLALNDEVGSASGLTDGELAEEKKAQDILERTIAGGKSVWSDEHDYPCLPGHANPDEDARRGSVREEKQSLRHANTIRAQRLEREATAAAQAAGNDLEWLTLALLREGHYFCEQCLTYDAPSFKRYTARHLSSIGVLDKDALAHLIDEYPSMRDTVREFTLLKFGKVCRRLTRHVERQRVLPPAALIDTRFEGNMMARVIEMWGGADKIRQQAEKRSTEYLTSIESIWHMFEPIDGVKVQPRSRRDVEEARARAAMRDLDDGDDDLDDGDVDRAMSKVLHALKRLEEQQQAIQSRVESDHHRITSIQRELTSIGAT